MNEAGSGRPTTIFDTKIALVSTGLSHIQRGYETFTLDLYEALKDLGSISLFKGSGWSAPPNTCTVPTLRRNSYWATRLFKDEAQRYRYEQISMALAGWMMGYWQDRDIIYFCDPTFGNVLLKLRKLFKYKYTLVFANCGPFDPKDYTQFDHIHEFTPDFYNRAKQSIRKTRLHLNPMGIWTERFNLDTEKNALRQEWKIPANKLVILSVASLDEPYKRLQTLIETVAALNDTRIHLVLVGQNQRSPYAQETLALAENKLAGRYQHMTVPYARIPELYKACDLFILPSLQEGFGKVYLEAMAAGLPLLCHNHPNTQWIVKAPESLIDMEDQTALTAAIRRMQGDDGVSLSDFAREMAETNRAWVNERFHWKALRQEYMDMYERILVLPV